MRNHTSITSSRWTLIALALLLAALVGGPALALGDSDSDSDESIFVRRAISLKDCPEVKVLGGGGARVISLSPRAFLGVEASNLTPELREHFGVPADAGVMLSKIVEDSAAEAAGLAVGDIVTRVNGEEISSAGRLGRAVRQQEDGDAVDIEYWRDGQVYQTTATLQARERCSVDIGDRLRAIKIEDLPELSALGVEIGGEALETTLETLRHTFSGEDWDFKWEGLSESEMERLEERMERVQERMQRLEERLEREFGREFERVERDLERAARDRERAARDLERAEGRRARDLERAERERARELERAEREQARELEEAERARERAARERAETDSSDGETI